MLPHLKVSYLMARINYSMSISSLTTFFFSTSANCFEDPHAYLAPCGGNCGKMCDDIESRMAGSSVICGQHCFVDTCSCKPKYLFDAEQNKCVHPHDCTRSKKRKNNTLVKRFQNKLILHRHLRP